MNLRLHVFFGQFVWLIAALNGKSFQGIPGYGRNLIVKTLPAIEDYQSNVYEVYMEPYLYDLRRPAFSPGDRAQKQIDLAGAPRSLQGLQAIVNLQDDEESGVAGELVFTQIVPNGPVTIEGNITGLSAGLHGLHVHQSGAIKDDCKSIGPHFIAYYGRHGGPRDHIRHVGDLGNIKAEDGETVTVKIVDHLISLAGPRSVVGRAVAVSKGEDDYGRAGTEDSALTGSSGPAVACGIIVGEIVTVTVNIVDHLISLAGPRSVVGRAVAVSKGEDDYGRAGTEDSALTGSSGPAVACGIIGYLN